MYTEFSFGFLNQVNNNNKKKLRDDCVSGTDYLFM